MFFQFGLVLLSAFTSPVWSYSEGAPNDQETCKTLFPGHFTQQQSSPPPYVIQLSKDIIKPKETIIATLKAQTDDNLIKGFMIQARENDIPIGKFEAGASNEYFQVRTCQTEADTASHKKIKGRGVNEISFKWTAPDTLKGPVSFVGTLVKNRPTFWVANKYAELTVA